MTDPISAVGLVASIATLIHVAKEVYELYKEFKDADTSINSKFQDIEFFQAALHGIDRARRNSHIGQYIPAPALDNIVHLSYNTIQDLTLRLQKIKNCEYSTMRGAKWVKHASKLNGHHSQLREQTIQLVMLLMIAHVNAGSAIQDTHPELLPLCDTAAGIAGVSPAGPFMFSQDSDSNHLDRWRTIEEIGDMPSEGGTTAESRELRQTPDALSSQGSSSYPLLIRQACRYDCHCLCHNRKSSKSRRTSLVWLLFKKPACTETGCRMNVQANEIYKSLSAPFREVLRHVVSAGSNDFNPSVFRDAMAHFTSLKSIKVRYSLHAYRTVAEGSDAMRYVKHGNLDKLKVCIESGEATIRDTAPHGWSLLHAACYNRQLPIVKYLIGLGADTEVADAGLRTPADLAALRILGQVPTQVEQDIFNVFSQKDDILSGFGFTPIHAAVLGLYEATDLERPSLESLIQLLDDANNAPPDTDWVAWKTRYDGRSPLYHAVLEYFRASAFEKPQSRIFHDLLEQPDKKLSWTPLHWASCCGRVDEIRTLESFGANPTVLSNLQANILHAGADSVVSAGLSWALEIWKQCSDELDINQVNLWRETPMHIASWSSAASVRLLLDAGAKPDVRQEDGQVPLHYAGLSEHSLNRQETVSLLCSTDDISHINMQDRDGRPALFEFLDDPICVGTLINRGAKTDLSDKHGCNAFHHVCSEGHTAALSTLLRLVDSNNPELRAKNRDGNTPLLVALSSSNVSCALLLLDLQDVGDTVGKDGWYPIHYAARIGDADLVHAIVNHATFRKKQRTLDGKKASVVAREAGNWNGRVKDLIQQYDTIFVGEA